MVAAPSCNDLVPEEMFVLRPSVTDVEVGFYPTTMNIRESAVDCACFNPFLMLIAGCADIVWYFYSRILFIVPLQIRN